jgi:hypothetical protein
LDLIESLIKGMPGIQIQKADLGMAIYNRQNVIKIMAIPPASLPIASIF